MAKVHTIDIQGEQWEIQDLPLTLIVEQIKQQMKDDNELSEPELVTVGTTEQTAFIAEYDGFFCMQSWQNGNVYLNSTQFSFTTGRTQPSGVYNGGNNTTFPIVKGDKIWSTNTSNYPRFVRYYKKRDYSNR